MAKIAAFMLVVAAVYAFLSFIAHRSIYYPLREGWWDLRAKVGAEDVWLNTPDGILLHGWWIRAPEASVTTLYLHGNGGNITHRSDRIPEISAAGSSLLLLDYRGYGKSGGRPSESGLYQDAEAGYKFLLERGIPPERIVIHGESLGTAVAVDLVSRRPCAGLVLEAPLTSARAVAAHVLPVLGPLLVSGFDSLQKITRVHVPLLIMHGDRDEVIAFEFGRQLFGAANQPKTFWPVKQAGHNDILQVAGIEYREKLRAFYQSLR